MKPKKPKFFYGWVIVVVCIFTYAAASLLSTALSTCLAAIRSEYGFTATQTANIITVRSIAAFVVVMFADRYYGTLGLKRGIAGAMLSGMVAFLFFAAAGTRLSLYFVGAVFAGINYAFGLMLPAALLTKRWFTHNRGTAMSIAGTGVGIVTAVGSPLIQHIISTSGLKTAFYLQAAFLLFVAVLVLVLVYNDPADKGLEPLGGQPVLNAAKKGRSDSGNTPVFRDPWVAALGLVMLVYGAFSSPLIAHFTLNFTTAGIDAATAAKGLSLYGVLLTVSKLLQGMYMDRRGSLRTTVLFILVLFAGYAFCFLILFFPSARVMYLSMLLYGAGTSIISLCYPGWCAELYPENYDKVMSRWQSFYQLGALVGSPFPGIVADATGSYAWAYLIGGVLVLLATGAVVSCFAAKKQMAVPKRV